MELTPEQRKATEHNKGPALVLSVPGSGKTTMLMFRLHNLISLGADPKRILTITFSKAATEDMKRRYHSLFPAEREPLFLTIHALCYSILKDWDRKGGRTRTLLGSKEAQKTEREILAPIFRKYNGSWPGEEEGEKFFRESTFLKNRRLSPEALLEGGACETPQFSEIFREYEEVKNRLRLFDFDDMILLAEQALGEDPALLRKYRGYFDYIQVDEAQDTSPAQFDVIYKLVNKEENLFLVADDDQSIYGFRGADPEGLFAFQRRYKNCRAYYMQVNFRSSKNIIELADKSIRHNRHRFPKEVTTPNPYRRPVSIIKCRHTEDQYSFILEKLRKEPKKDTAILFRNSLSALGILLALEGEGIPFSARETQGKYFRSFLLKDLEAFLTLAKHPDSLEDFERIYYKIKGYLSKKQLKHAKNLGMKNVFDAMALTPGLKEFQKRGIYEIKGDFNHLATLSPKDALPFILDHLKYRDYLKSHAKRTGKSLEQLLIIYRNYMEIAKKAKTFSEFFGRIQYLKEYLTQRSLPRGVTVSTIHGAKGLEFQRVFLIDLSDNILPSSRSIREEYRGHPEAMEEERRLFYVGMTRAKEELFLLTPMRILQEPRTISRFLEEIEPELKK